MKIKRGNLKKKKKSELSNSKIICLIEFSSYVTRFFYIHFFIWSYEKLAMTS